MRRVETWRRIGVVAALIGAACGTDGPSGNNGSIEVVVAPGALTVAQGGTGSVTATLTRGGGFDGAVTLAISGLPAGVTTAITPAQLSGNTTTATVQVTVALAVPTGTYAATITASAQGVGQATATYTLTVTGTPTFVLAVSPTSRSIVAGGSSSATVAITRSGFAGPVAFVLVNPPAGIAATFDPTPATTDGTAITVTIAASVPPGNYPLTIQGTAAGPGARTTTLTVTVPAPPAGGTVEYQFCDPAEAPVFVAFQNGDGPWQKVTGSVSGSVARYAMNITLSRGGVLFVYPPAASVALGMARVPSLRRQAERSRESRMPALLEDAYVTQVLYGSAVELAQDGLESCAITQPTKTMTVNVAGVPPGAYGIYSVGGVGDIFDGAASTNPRQFFGVPSGPIDVVGSRTVPGAAPNRVLVSRNLNIPDGGTVPTVDFSGAASSAPVTATATIAGGGADDLEIFVDLVTANGVGALWSDLSPGMTATRPWGGLAPAAMQAGDLHSLVAFATPPGSLDFRVTVKHVGPVANHVLALGPALVAPASSQVAGGAYPRFRFQGALPADYGRGAAIDVLGVEGTGNVYSILATGAWLAAAGNPLGYDLTMPDVAGLAGFPLASRLTAGTNDLDASAWGFIGTGVFDLRPNLGTELKAALRAVTLVVP